jgi:serine/threonine protein phosphatase PrpC
VQIEAFGHTDIGRRREGNEDSYLCLDLDSRGTFPWRPFFLLAVADGIGGHAGGAAASALAVETFRDILLDRLKGPGPVPEHPKLLAEAFAAINARIYAAAAADSALSGMGTTLVAALVAGDRATIANVGDSRAYLIREKAIRQVTLDHSWAAEQTRLNLMTEDEIRRSPFKSMITRSLGYAKAIAADTFEIVFLPEDYLLLCTDGLYGAVPVDELLKIVRRRKSPEKICRRMIQRANHHGGRDNITQVVARFREDGKRAKTLTTDTVKIRSTG